MRTQKAVNEMCSAAVYEVPPPCGLEGTWDIVLAAEDAFSQAQLEALARAANPATRAYGRELIHRGGIWTCPLIIDALTDEAMTDETIIMELHGCQSPFSTGVLDGTIALESAPEAWARRIRQAQASGRAIRYELCSGEG